MIYSLHPSEQKRVADAPCFYPSLHKAVTDNADFLCQLVTASVSITITDYGPSPYIQGAYGPTTGATNQYLTSCYHHLHISTRPPPATPEVPSTPGEYAPLRTNNIN
ncbi:hypothetical protein DKX38_014150 [Salix brachista]|uniref:Uncharacterized protein n=1 Tax=Salix brachista TaxID=2182728 RepID=A0A5N5LGT2_9ROSI|nr:hypothetical protein DKX38_014150 [Salix brachista]